MTRIAEDIRRAVLEGAEEALVDALQTVHDRAVHNMPIGDPSEDPNPAVALAESGRITIDPGGNSGTVGFYAPYAAKQELARHFEHPRGGDSRYLERALLQTIPDLENIFASKIRARIRHRDRRYS